MNYNSYFKPTDIKTYNDGWREIKYLPVDKLDLNDDAKRYFGEIFHSEFIFEGKVNGPRWDIPTTEDMEVAV